MARSYTIANERHTLRPWQLWAWQAGKEALVHQEADPAWLLSLYRTRTTATWLQSNNHDGSEQYLLDEGGPTLLRARERGLEYYLDTQGERAYTAAYLAASPKGFVQDDFECWWSPDNGSGIYGDEER